jgi:hypothetical protein
LFIQVIFDYLAFSRMVRLRLRLRLRLGLRWYLRGLNRLNELHGLSGLNSRLRGLTELQSVFRVGPERFPTFWEKDGLELRDRETSIENPVECLPTNFIQFEWDDQLRTRNRGGRRRFFLQIQT